MPTTWSRPLVERREQWPRPFCSLDRGRVGRPPQSAYSVILPTVSMSFTRSFHAASHAGSHGGGPDSPPTAGRCPIHGRRRRHTGKPEAPEKAAARTGRTGGRNDGRPDAGTARGDVRSEEQTSELQS